MNKFILLSIVLCGCAVKHQPKLQPTAADENLMRDFCGKPYLDPPKGWHWVCSQYDKAERCYIDKN